VCAQRKGRVRTQQEGHHLQGKAHWKPTLLASWSWTSRLLKCETIIFSYFGPKSMVVCYGNVADWYTLTLMAMKPSCHCPHKTLMTQYRVASWSLKAFFIALSFTTTRIQQRMNLPFLHELNTVICYLTTRMCFEKCVFKWYCGYENIIELMDTNLDGIVQTLDNQERQYTWRVRSYCQLTHHIVL
jgi:hypothetical protein